MTQPINNSIGRWNALIMNKQYKCEEDCMSTRCPAQGHIPNVILMECASAAFAATECYYNGYTSVGLHDQPLRIQRRIEKDVKAVLLGNRTPAQLHHAWADRKYESVGKKLGKLKDVAPSAAKMFSDLSKEDQDGYEIFVNTVRKTYDASKLPTKVTEPVPNKEYGLLAAAIKAKTVCLEFAQDGKWNVTFTFNDPKDAQELFTLSAK
jgi:hypothetical protein